jgi:hypothetical protein
MCIVIGPLAVCYALSRESSQSPGGRISDFWKCWSGIMNDYKVTKHVTDSKFIIMMICPQNSAASIL